MNNSPRQVRVFKWQWNDDAKRSDKVFDYFATFHCFGTHYEELTDGIAQFPCAIVEKENGEVCMPPADLIKFMSRGKQ